MKKWTTNDKFARKLCLILQIILVLLLIFFTVSIIMTLLGRIAVHLHITSSEQTFDNPVLLNYKSVHNSGFYLTPNTELHFTLQAPKLSLLSQIIVRLYVVFTFIPNIFAFLFLYPLLTNVSEKKVFSTQNANYLSKAGFSLLIGPIIASVCKLFVFPFLIRQFTSEVLTISSQIQLLYSDMILGVILLIIAYIFHYGIYLQGEVDSTL